MSSRRAFITGITGQDGSYLAELLLAEGYRVTGLVRHDPAERLPNVEHLRAELELIVGDIRAPDQLASAIRAARPDELYHLAAPTFVPDSWDRPAETLAATAGATATVLETAREGGAMRVYVATSSEIFGAVAESPQREDTGPRPASPYGVGKLAGHLLAGVMRAGEGLHVSSGITYNHESPRRPERFVSRKVTRAAAAIKLGKEREVVLGDLDAVRDWSYAADVVRAAWLMLAQDEPGDYVVASGVPRTVRELAQTAFAHVGLAAEDHVRVDAELVRPPEEAPLLGDASRARERLGWQPETSFQAMIAAMVEADLADLSAKG